MHVDTRRVHIPVNDASLVESSDGRRQLPEHAERVEQAHRGLAELLPCADVLGRLRAEGNRTNIFERGNLEYVKQVRVLRRLNCLLEMVQDWLLCNVCWAEVDRRHHVEASHLGVGAPVDDYLAVVRLGVKNIGQVAFAFRVI